MTEQSQVRVLQAGDHFVTECFRCNRPIDGIDIAADGTYNGIDLHPECAHALGQELLDATKGEPTP